MSFNKVVDEMETAVLMRKIADSVLSGGDTLMHYGVSVTDGAPGRGSGRYPLGSGENPLQHGGGDILDRILKLEKKINPETGKLYTEAEIAAEIGLYGRSGKPSSGKLRAWKDILKTERRSAEFARATKLREEGLSLQQIADEMGYTSESSIRNILNEDKANKRSVAMTTADYLKDVVDKSDFGMLDVGKGSERFLGVSKAKLDEALEILQVDGYEVYGGGIPQPTNPGQQTNQLVLCKPGTEHKEIYQFNKISSLSDPFNKNRLMEDGEKIKPAFAYPESISSKRIEIKYGDQGGIRKDGVIEIRPGVEDLSLGESHYAQVRILVDGKHYLKGMALYSDDLPDGVDIRFNTNKSSGTPIEKVLKPITSDPSNPFGANLRVEGGQSYYIGKDGKEHLSAINKTRQEGDWKDWKDTIPSQFLSKQPVSLAKKQLKLAEDDKIGEFNDIMELTNPTIKRLLLSKFADSCDSAAVDLKAMALPRQKYQVILPLDTIKDNEIYAPNYKDGETVALIRYPHGGTFEIPILKVNNKQKEGRKVLGTSAVDAVGINANVAGRLSGADFDGDTVMVIPCNEPGKPTIKSKQQLKGLEGFDPKLSYPEREGMKYMKNTQTEMGIISNLITDMTIKGAKEDELARAVRHSMVVIDAEKHKLDYKRSEADNGIAELKRKYQQKDDGSVGGASTIISRASGQKLVDKREGSRMIDPNTGKVTWKTAPDSKLYYTKVKQNAAYKKFTGTDEFKNLSKEQQSKKIKEAVADGILTEERVKRTQKSTQMMEVDDARELMSRAAGPMEIAYADYANSMKALANQARKEMLATPRLEKSNDAAKKYATEVEHLNAQLEEAERQKVRERSAIRKADVRIEEQRRIYEEAGLTKEEMKKEMKKARQRELIQARIDEGSERVAIQISDKEWEAIQAGAISDTKLMQILGHTDTDVVKKLATPRSSMELSPWKVSKIKAMNNNGYTNEEIARSLGISASTVSNYL